MNVEAQFFERNNNEPTLFLQDENDVYILTKVSDILHSVFSSYKEKVLPWFEQLLQLIVQLIVSTFIFFFSPPHQSHYINIKSGNYRNTSHSEECKNISAVNRLKFLITRLSIVKL